MDINKLQAWSDAITAYRDRGDKSALAEVVRDYGVTTESERQFVADVLDEIGRPDGRKSRARLPALIRRWNLLKLLATHSGKLTDESIYRSLDNEFKYEGGTAKRMLLRAKVDDTKRK